MAQWEGKSRGTVLGYKIFVFFMRFLGIRSAYVLLYFVAFYFVIFSRKGTQASYYYFKHRLGFSTVKSVVSAYLHAFRFGQTIIDKVAIRSGLRDHFTYEFDGIEQIKQLLAEQKGGVMISAHVGNFEIADFFFKEIDINAQINIVTVDNERDEIKEYLDGVSDESNLKSIFIKEDLSHIFDIHAALDRNELICFTGDRYFEGNKTMEAELLGKQAKFPAGPFLIASRLNVPVLFVYVMKESGKHYHLYARRATVKKRDTHGLLKQYTQSIEGILKEYPLQWFNFFNFWKT